MNLKLKIRAFVGSLKVQLVMPILLVAVIIVLALTLLVSHTYTQTILEQENSKVQSSFLFTGNNISELMKNAREVASALLVNSKIEYYTTGTFRSDLDRVYARIDVLSEIDEALWQQPSLYGILFLRKDDTVFGSLPRRNYFEQPDTAYVLSDDVIQQVRSGKTSIGPYSGADLYCIQILSPIPDSVVFASSTRHSSLYGDISALAVFDVETLTHYLNLLEDGRSRLYLVTEEGVELTRAGTDEPFSPETWSAIDPSAKQSSFALTKPSTGERVYVCHQKIDSLNWYLVRELPMQFYEQTVVNLQTTVWFIAGGVLLVAVALLQVWLRSFMKTFEALHTAIGRLRQGRMETRIERPFRITEFESIRQEFNSMNAELETLMQTNSAMERAQLELELRSLQTQLSPHMIFNTITAIRWIAVMVGADRVSDMLLELVEMLRPVFRDWKIEWSLGEELSHLSHYAKLLDLRYGNNFSMICDIPEEMHAVQLPRFTFQPLVENTCEHNRSGVENLRVEICGWMEAGRVCFCVSDNGSGISPERLEEITRRIESGERGDSVGLHSVYNRLRLCIGKEARMRIVCPPEGGTKVYLDWPMIQKSY